jgi:hypothetical protein
MAGDRTEDRIRDKAYALWEQEGRPEGAHDRHWDMARRMVEEEDGDEAAPSDGLGWRPEVDGLNPIQGSSDASESLVRPVEPRRRPND